MKLEQRSLTGILKMHMQRYADTNIIVLAVQILVPLAVVLITVSFWQSMPEEKFPIYGMTKEQLVTYVLFVFLFKEQFNINTPITELLWEGSIVSYYARPLPLLYQFSVETVGKFWLFKALTFSLPAFCIAYYLELIKFPFYTKNILGGVVSFLLTIVLGFAVDIIFSALSILLKDGSWSAHRIRVILIIVFSGQLFPLQLLPKGWKNFFLYSPFGSLANAPLSILLGLENNVVLRVGIQAFWCVLLCYLAEVIFRNCEESMVSQGG